MSRKKKDYPGHDFIINKQLRAVMPSIPPEEQRALEAKVIRGEAEPIVVWDNTILKGYDVLKISQARGAPLTVKSLPCLSLDEAMEWACCYAYYFCPNSTEAYKKYWIGQRYLCGRRNRRTYGHQIEETDVYDHILNIIRQHRSSLMLSNELHVSIGSIQKYGMYAKAIDSIISKNPVMGMSILQERIHVSHNKILLLEQLNAEELRRVNYRFDLGGAKIVGISPEPSPTVINRSTRQPGIKAMPEYDPDSEFTGLLLTAKTWTSSLERTYRVADFKNASEKVKKQVKETLLDLKDTVDLFCLSLEDDKDG